VPAAAASQPTNPRIAGGLGYRVVVETIPTTVSCAFNADGPFPGPVTLSTHARARLVEYRR